MKRVAELDRKQRVDNFVTRYAWGISGAFLVMIAVGGVFSRNVNANQVQSSEIASTFAMVPTPASRAAAPTAYDHWLDGLLQHAKVSSDPTHLEVRGWAVGDLEGRRVVKVALRDLNGDLALLMIPGNVSEGMGDSVSSGSFVSGKINGMNSVAKNIGAQSIILVGDRSYDQLSEILSRIALRNP